VSIKGEGMTDEVKFKTYEMFRQRIHAHLYQLTGTKDLKGAEIAALIRRIANAYEMTRDRFMPECELSAPRLGLLMRLEAEERRGNSQGITPTALSHNQDVSRNTISALLNGLEEQGLIERKLDPLDRRGFRIRITDKGRKTVIEYTPRLVDFHKRLAGTLTPAEQTQLIDLLIRLYAGITDITAHQPQVAGVGDSQKS
jgi:DNA-binding MarR family transcriptional regulator